MVSYDGYHIKMVLLERNCQFEWIVIYNEAVGIRITVSLRRLCPKLWWHKIRRDRCIPYILVSKMYIPNHIYNYTSNKCRHRNMYSVYSQKHDYSLHNFFFWSQSWASK
jgi:hypothetical protein